MPFTRRNLSNKKRPPAKKDTNAYVLDILSSNRGFKDEEIAQVIGKDTYHIFEVILKENHQAAVGNTIYVGPEERPDIKFIKRGLTYDDLNTSAQQELEYALYDIIKEQEEKFIHFLNNAGLITIRKHSLELIPGIGKTYVKEIITVRDEGAFLNFEDVHKRISFIQDMPKLLVERILVEIKKLDDFKLFYA